MDFPAFDFVRNALYGIAGRREKAACIVKGANGAGAFAFVVQP